MNKEISRSFIDELAKNNLSAKDIALILVRILNSKLSYLLQFKSLEEYISIQKTLEFNNKEKSLEDITTIECYIASVILRSIETGNSKIFEILIQNEGDDNRDLYKLMSEGCK